MNLVSLDTKKSSFLVADDSGISLTSPGTVSPVSKISHNQDDNKTVFNVLYKPDLIRLSSPLRKSKNEIISRLGLMNQIKFVFVINWLTKPLFTGPSEATLHWNSNLDNRYGFQRRPELNSNLIRQTLHLEELEEEVGGNVLGGHQGQGRH